MVNLMPLALINIWYAYSPGQIPSENIDVDHLLEIDDLDDAIRDMELHIQSFKCLFSYASALECVTKLSLCKIRLHNVADIQFVKVSPKLHLHYFGTIQFIPQQHSLNIHNCFHGNNKH